MTQVAARVNSAYNQDPNEVGYQWRGLSHMCLLVDIEGDRYLVDVGFGGGSPEYPAPLNKTSHIRSFVDGESFELRKEVLPGADRDAFIDVQKGATSPTRRILVEADRDAQDGRCIGNSLRGKGERRSNRLAITSSNNRSSPPIGRS